MPEQFAPSALPSSSLLTAGAPRFLDAPFAGSDASQTSASAWTSLLAEGDAGQLARTLQRVQGNFAVGVRFPSGRTVLAIDRMAVEPLCYRVVDGTLQFAQQAHQLAASAEIDAQGIFDYLYFHAIPAPRTIFKDVLRLPPGHFALFENGKLSVQPYWVPAFDPLPVREASFADLKEEFTVLLEQAVRRQLGEGVPACYLSGGTDSSTIAGMIGRVAGRPAEAFSIGFEAQGYDEMEYARLAARHFGSHHHEYYVTPADLVRRVPDVAAHYDQPFGNSSALPAFYCAEMAHGQGVTRMLAGDGGDELFGGNTRYARQKVLNAYQGIPEGLRHGLLEPVARSADWLQRVPLLKKGVSYVNQARVPMPDRTMTHNLIEGIGLEQALTPEFLARIDAAAPHRLQREVWSQARGTDLVDRMLAFDWRFTLADCDLPKVVGTSGMAGMSVGFPMLDDDLLAFSMRLPASYKVKGLKLRWFFKEALRGFLPDEILVKKKQGFGLPFGVWLVRDQGLKHLAADSVASLVDRRLIPAAFAQRLLNDYLLQHPGYYGEMVWILMMLEQWLRARAPEWRVTA